jgi:hypothetical protein
MKPRTKAMPGRAAKSSFSIASIWRGLSLSAKATSPTLSPRASRAPRNTVPGEDTMVAGLCRL